MGNTCGSIPNILFTQNEVDKIKAASGNSIIEELKKIEQVCVLIQKHKDNIGTMASDMINQGIEAITAKSGIVVNAALKEKRDLTSAVKAGVSAGSAPDIASFAVVILNLFRKLTKEPKATIGLIINETQYDIGVNNWRLGFDVENINSDLYMAHGRMLEFMEDKTTATTSQIMKRPETGGAYGGLYLMTKRDSALIGVESTMKLTVGSDKIDFLSCCPYSQDNRINLKLNSGKTPKEIHSELYNDKRKERSISNSNIEITAKVNSHSGSPSYVIVTIKQTR